ncbi:MAG: hypothetical protein E7649_02455 [Ruminococcaceae bacterium]|nr:hypothetical protein [Oscillospiraceae bacterium]
MSDIANIEKILGEQGVYVSTTSGVSMVPMLRDRRDTIVIKPAKERLKKYDVALYRRGDSYVLHRVIKVLPDSYVIRGDNCIKKEFGITDADILGKLVEFYRKDKRVDMNKLSYRAYCVMICAAHPFVSLKLRLKFLFARKRAE